MTVRTGVLVVGASAAGLATAEALRRDGYEGSIIMIGDEPHAPYDRPPLSKQVLSGTWESAKSQLRPAEHLDGLDLEIATGETALRLDVAARTVHTDRRAITADHIVIATGATPRRLPGQPELRGLHTFRTVDDALALRADLANAARVVVVGEGVLGAEIAATAREMGLGVTVVGPQSSLMAGQLGPEVSDVLTRTHADRGVRLRLGEQVTGFAECDGRVQGVRVAGGEIIPAGVVVVAVGATPTTGWLADSGLRIDDGVVCDEYCRAADGVYAVGDVARFAVRGAHEPTTRLENRTNATEQAMAVASSILGEATAYSPVPYFWSDQFGNRIQVDGTIPAQAQATIVDGAVETGRFVARYERDGVICGVIGWNMPKQSRRHRNTIGRASLDVDAANIGAADVDAANAGAVA